MFKSWLVLWAVVKPRSLNIVSQLLYSDYKEDIYIYFRVNYPQPKQKTVSLKFLVQVSPLNCERFENKVIIMKGMSASNRYPKSVMGNIKRNQNLRIRINDNLTFRNENLLLIITIQEILKSVQWSLFWSCQ